MVSVMALGLQGGKETVPPSSRRKGSTVCPSLLRAKWVIGSHRRYFTKYSWLSHNHTYVIKYHYCSAGYPKYPDMSIQLVHKYLVDEYQSLTTRIIWIYNVVISSISRKYPNWPGHDNGEKTNQTLRRS